MAADRFDYVIVGAGSAGCVLANRLSADPSVRVLLLEAGERDNYLWIHIPVGYLYCIDNPRTDWRFRTEAESGLNGRSLIYPRGRVLGGCSSINGMIYMRGQREDYDGWRDAGNAGWGWDDVLPLFKKSEDHVGGANEFHGQGGEWRVEGQRLRWDILDAFRDAAAEAGVKPIKDFNCGSNEGCAYFEVNQRGGWRWNTAKAFLKPVMKRPNLVIQTGAHVRRLTFEGRRATGVEYERHGQRHTVVAEAETVLCAGAIGSPHLLQLSGVGEPQQLAAHGIGLVQALPGVGENLQDHLQLRMAFKIKDGLTLNTLAATHWGKLKIGMHYLAARRGPMSMAPSQLGAFARSASDVERADLEYHVQPLSLEKFGDPLHPFAAFTASVCHLRPESRGFVRLRSGHFSDAPLIAPNYLSAEGDRRVAARAIRLTRRIVAQAPMARYRPEEFKPGPEFVTDEELARAAGAIGTTIFHPVGTCKMGNDPLAVVDHRLRVLGVESLRVVDASIMPTITSGNTGSPTVMIAEKAAAMMQEDRLARLRGRSSSPPLTADTPTPARPAVPA